ncbi:hypothetical protein KKE74_01320 [Patescibacteria group bacterium]|nr:hypothetical protein [Patescibacteria group bacterium]
MKKSRWQKRKEKNTLKKIFFRGMFFCLLIGITYFLIWSPFLWIENIEIRSSKVPLYYTSLEIREIVENNLEEKLWRIISQKSIALISSSKIKNDILDQFPEINEVIIQRKLPNILIVKIWERESIGVWCQYHSTSTEEFIERKIDQCFYIDQQGIIYRQAPLMKGNLVLNIYSAKNQTADIRTQVTSPEIIEFILAIEQGIEKIKMADKKPLTIIDFEIISLEDLRVTTLNDYQIYFNPAYSTELQLQALEMILEKEIKQDYVSLEYIDLRIQDRVYYKVRPEKN